MSVKPTLVLAVAEERPAAARTALADREWWLVLDLYESLLDAGYESERAVAHIAAVGGYAPAAVAEALGF